MPSITYNKIHSFSSEDPVSETTKLKKINLRLCQLITN